MSDQARAAPIPQPGTVADQRRRRSTWSIGSVGLGGDLVVLSLSCSAVDLDRVRPADHCAHTPARSPQAVGVLLSLATVAMAVGAARDGRAGSPPVRRTQRPFSSASGLLLMAWYWLGFPIWCSPS